MSASEHIHNVLSDNAQTLHALHVLRHHGLNEIGLQTVFRAAVVSRLMYASPAWRGFVTSSDLQRVPGFIRLCRRNHYCPPDMPDIDELMDEADRQTTFSQHLEQPASYITCPAAAEVRIVADFGGSRACNV